MKITVIGAGGIGRMHAAHLMSTPGLTHVELVGRDPDRLAAAAEAVRERAGAEAAAEVDLSTTTDLEGALEVTDGVVIATPGRAHPGLVAEAVRRGLPAFVEKPLALTAEDYLRLLREVEAAGADERVMVGFHRRHGQEHRTLKGLLDAERAGTLRSVHSVNADRWIASPEALGESGGLWLDLMMHDFDAVPWLVSERAERVYAVGGALQDRAHAEHGQIDTAHAVLHFGSGLVATLVGIRGNASGQDVRTVVHGSRATYSVGETAGLAVSRIDPEGGIHSTGAVYEDYQERFAPAFVREMQEFVDLITGRGRNASPPSSGLHAFEIALTAQRSAETGEPEKVERLR
jgi:predicted dehydrogenase